MNREASPPPRLASLACASRSPRPPAAARSPTPSDPEGPGERRLDAKRPAAPQVKRQPVRYESGSDQ